MHPPDGHRLFEHRWPILTVDATARVLVPLCGKGFDRRRLAERGYRRVGIELCAIAARDFFEEQASTPTSIPLVHSPAIEADATRVP